MTQMQILTISINILFPCQPQHCKRLPKIGHFHRIRWSTKPELRTMSHISPQSVNISLLIWSCYRKCVAQPMSVRRKYNETANQFRFANIRTSHYDNITKTSSTNPIQYKGIIKYIVKLLTV